MINLSVKFTVYSEAAESIPVSAFHERKQLNYEQETCPPAVASTTGEIIFCFFKWETVCVFDMYGNP